MNLLNRLRHHVTPLICLLSLCAGQIAHADDIEDANKLFKRGQHSQALAKVNGYLAEKPKDAQARFLKGLIFTEQGKTTDAIKMFSALTEDYPELPEPYNNLAVLYASQGQYEKARLALEMAIRTHPSYATAHENLGDIYAKMASQAYDRALQLDRSNTATQTKLAMIQDLFGDGATRAGEPSAPVQNSPALSKAEAATPVVETEDPAPPVTSQAAPDAPAAIKPSPVVAPTALQKDQSKEVMKAVNAWAAAWSSRDTDKYLSFYAADFKTPDRENRADWEAARRERIGKPKSIRIGISNATVKFSDSDHATVSFRQSYRASHLKTSGKKTLLMVKSGGAWLIREERSR